MKTFLNLLGIFLTDLPLGQDLASDKLIYSVPMVSLPKPKPNKGIGGKIQREEGPLQLEEAPPILQTWDWSYAIGQACHHLSNNSYACLNLPTKAIDNGYAAASTQPLSTSLIPNICILNSIRNRQGHLSEQIPRSLEQWHKLIIVQSHRFPPKPQLQLINSFQSLLRYMKSLLFTTACALAVSTVSAGLGMGACPAVSSVAYSSDMQTTRKHNLLYIHKSAFGYMKMAKKFVSAIPDVSCLALGEFPYPDQTTYDDLYVTPTGLLSFKMIHYDVDTLSEVQYACFDYAKVASYIDGLASLPVPKWLVKIGLQVLRLGHFDLTFIFTDSASFTAPQIAAITTGIQAKFPKFAWKQLSMLDRTSCV